MYELYTVTFGHLGQVGWSLMVQFITQLHILLCLIHIGIGCTVDNAAYTKLAHHAFYGIDITYIKFCHIGKVIGHRRLAIGYHAHLIAQLSIGTSDKYILHFIIIIHYILLFQVQFARAFLVIVIR